jgi:hypothetical protein
MEILRSVACTLSLLLAVSAAHAQSVRVSANVPFDFIVGKQVFPAGSYRLIPGDSTGNAVIIRNRDESSYAGIVLTQSCSKNSPAGKTALMFHRVGSLYFLDQVWVEGWASGRQFGKSTLETQMAGNHNDREEVIVAAQITH